MSRTPPRRGIRSGVRARARRNVFLLRAAAERQVDPLSVAVVHSIPPVSGNPLVQRGKS